MRLITIEYQQTAGAPRRQLRVHVEALPGNRRTPTHKRVQRLIEGYRWHDAYVVEDTGWPSEAAE